MDERSSDQPGLENGQLIDGEERNLNLWKDPLHFRASAGKCQSGKCLVDQQHIGPKFGQMTQHFTGILGFPHGIYAQFASKQEH